MAFSTRIPDLSRFHNVKAIVVVGAAGGCQGEPGGGEGGRSGARRGRLIGRVGGLIVVVCLVGVFWYLHENKPETIVMMFDLQTLPPTL